MCDIDESIVWYGDRHGGVRTLWKELEPVATEENKMNYLTRAFLLKATVDNLLDSHVDDRLAVIIMKRKFAARENYLYKTYPHDITTFTINNTDNQSRVRLLK